ncbi:putative addiction module antidote protein [Rheinheimera sp. MA13]|uniref:Addiction module antidote protein n=2 Tax=Rheinheimera maricola TaxID=2793282 RepID=A0ABS7XC49_9GAMM|nr:addiction module antidote protein [Rheinheimera maricola]MBZ9612630.1 putative addiction module antidote protein [Rheinheimera maricola]
MGLIGPPKAAGVHFKRYLQRKNLTAADAARDLNVAKSTITRFINGESELSIELATKIKRVYTAPVEVFFKTDEDIQLYLEACIEEAADDPVFIVHALGVIANAKNMSQLARDTGISREGLYKAFSPDGNPTFATVAKVAKALGLQITVQTIGNAKLI